MVWGEIYMECMYTDDGCARTGCTFRGVSCGRDKGDDGGYRGASAKEILVQPSSSRGYC